MWPAPAVRSLSISRSRDQQFGQLVEVASGHGYFDNWLGVGSAGLVFLHVCAKILGSTRPTHPQENATGLVAMISNPHARRLSV